MRKAQRRLLAIRVFEAFCLGATVAVAGLICLLLAGTQVLDWYWPFLLGAAGLIAGLARAARRRISNYRLAQALDQRLQWDDRLSTAVYFEQQTEHSPAIDIVQSQLAPLLERADLRRAVPARVPSAVYAAAALAAVAAGLLGVRYGVLHTLDLRHPLANINLDTFLAPPKKVQAATTRKSAIQEQLEQQLQQMGLQVGDPAAESVSPEQMEAPAAPNEQQSKPGPGRQSPTGEPDPTGDGKEEQASTEQGNEASDSKGAEAQPGDQGQPPGKGNQQQRADARNNEGLMNRMRDALANLLSKMKQSGAKEGSEQQASAQQEGNQQPGRQQDPNQTNTPGQSRSQSNTQTNAQESGQSPDAQSQQMAGQKGQPGDKSADQPGNQSAKSGMGSQDGEKQIREAQQLAAMGKISEIFGKRAQQITGEMTVEVSSGNQQLKTKYSGKEAAHSDTGAEVHRDVIPLAYQTYIQRYYEELRKQDAKLKN